MRSITRWTVLHALSWAAVGAGAVLATEWLRPAPPSLSDLADQAVERMGELELSALQRESLAAIRARWREAIVAEEASWQQRVTAAAAAADREVEALLTPEQARRWRMAGGQAPSESN
jgi:hypothetical protein